jgi:predicted ATP-grasp superfamily ATP-dependent carboligase
VKPIIYVTRDIERALGIDPSKEFIIITNKTPLGEEIKTKFPDFVHLLSGSAKNLSTLDILKNETTKKIISDANANLMVFKNSSAIEAVAKDNGWILLNPPADLSEKIENKITQVEWLGEIGVKYLPPHKIMTVEEIVIGEEPLIIQWAHGHSGDGTILIKTTQELNELKKKFPERPVRVSDFIVGPSFTVNVVVSSDKILVSNISYQITGLSPFTDNQFTTIGNDWSVTHSLLNEHEIAVIEVMTKEIGGKMKESGWRGLFGIDIIMDSERNQIYLIEINARQPASTTYESHLQQEFRKHGLSGLTTFEAHLSALTDKSESDELILINDGSQIVQRITKKIHSIKNETVSTLKLNGYQVLQYENTEENSDLLRIQSSRGIIESHNKLNIRGKEIKNVISPVVEIEI